MASRARNKLNIKQVSSFTKIGIYSDGGGLYLRVRSSGRSWFFIGALNGKRLEMGLGSVLDVSLAKAREKAATARAAVLDGHETMEFEREVVEMALAHTVASKTERAYRRGRALEKRRGLMAAWADYCFSLSPESQLAQVENRWGHEPPTVASII